MTRHMPGTMMGPGMMGPRWNRSYGPMMGRGPGGQYGPGTPVQGYPVAVPAGQVSFVVRNTGVWIHELMVLPLGPGQYPGQRPIGVDNRVDESASLGEAAPCGSGGDNHDIVPAATAWTTITLPPGHYELVCNIAGHYAAGMYTELDVDANR